MIGARRVLSAALPFGLSLALAAGCDIGERSAGEAGGSSGTSSTGASGTGSTSSGSGTGGTTGSMGSSSGTTSTSSSSTSSGAPVSGLQVSGNKLVDNGTPVRLLGVNRSGTEYQCIHGAGFYDGPTDGTSVAAMKAWHINTVRVPLNEDCWLGINGAPSGPAYQAAISQWVSTLRQGGLYVIVDLHWNNGGSAQATGQEQMADLDHAPDFWKGVASAFMGDLGVVFDLYNEPHDISWQCWLNGGCQVNGWNVAGMNQLIQAVRNTGAKNVVMAGGLSFSGDLSQWLANKPTDPTGNLAASFHSYNFSNCNESGCWGSQLQPVAATVPLITGELGENDCDNGSSTHPPGANYINGFMSWADANGVSYLGWAWNPDFDHCGGPALNSSGNWSGTAPTSPFGTDFQAHLMSVGP